MHEVQHKLLANIVIHDIHPLITVNITAIMLQLTTAGWNVVSKLVNIPEKMEVYGC